MEILSQGEKLFNFDMCPTLRMFQFSGTLGESDFLKKKLLIDIMKKKLISNLLLLIRHVIVPEQYFYSKDVGLIFKHSKICR